MPGPTAPAQPLPLGLSRYLSAPRPPAPGGGRRKTLHTRGLDHLPSVDRLVNPVTTPLPHLLRRVSLGRLYPPVGFSLQSVPQSDPQVSMVCPPTPPRGAPVAPAECTEGWAPRLRHLPLPRVVPLDPQAGFGLQTLCRFGLSIPPLWMVPSDRTTFTPLRMHLHPLPGFSLRSNLFHPGWDKSSPRRWTAFQAALYCLPNPSTTLPRLLSPSPGLLVYFIT